MEYCDVTLDGAKYRGVRFSLYRPEKTEYGASPESSLEYHQENNGYYTNTIYWFRYEPLQWCVLDLSTGLAMCETVIDSQPYSNFILYSENKYYGDAEKTYYANNYAESSLRQWLNDDFYNTAFTNAQKSKIAETELDNRAFDPSYSVYDSASTTDKVFLLSYSDLLNPAYGFETDPDYSETRVSQFSDYAKCQGLNIIANNYHCWWLRSPGEWSDGACDVFGNDCYGAPGNQQIVSNTCIGVRPAITLDLRETPTVTIPTGLTATYGQTLADITLTNPDGNIPGVWTWDDPTTFVGELEEHTFPATFTPDDITTYCPVHADLTVTVSEPSFTGHSISLNGDIGVSYYVNIPDALVNTGTAVVNFSWTSDGNEKTSSVTLTPANKTSNGYAAKCLVSAAEMACPVTATITVGGVLQSVTDTYSAKQYAETILTNDTFRTNYIASENAAGRNGEERYQQLTTLVKTMLDFGSKAQIRFDCNTGNLANGGTDHYTGIETITKTADDMSEGLASCGLKYVGSSVVYLSEMTLRHYYTIEDPSLFTQDIQNNITFDGSYVTYAERSGMIYFEKTGIAAPNFDTLYAICIGGKEYRYSVLDYSATALASGTTSQAAKDLASALYRYNIAANAYFGN